MILFITLPEAQDKTGIPATFPLELLPRRCPLCGVDTIIGHGQRRRQAQDHCHDWIWVRRGICHPCSKTFTILPDCLAPSGHFTLLCRQQACESIAAGASVEQAPPHCKDPSRSPDPSTVRRWAHRRLISVLCWVTSGAMGVPLLQTPTILAWDLGAVCRILPFEARSP